MRAPSLPFQKRLKNFRRPMSRDKSDTLLLLASCALVLILHSPHLPLSGTLAFSALLLWRAWITYQGLRLPPRWLLIPIAILAMASVYATHKTFFGRDAGVAMLTLLLTLKLLEMHAKHDLFVVIFLSFFLLLANFFYSQSIGTALLTTATLIAILTAQLSFQYTGEIPPLKRRLGTSVFILSLAAPLMLVLFILFPRIQGPLWGLPRDARSGTTGLSDTMTPGNISQLAQSDDIAFRVKFLDPIPPNSKLYWRGAVLTQYDGRTWSHQETSRRPRKVPSTPHGTPIRQQVTIEPSGRHWLFALELPSGPPILNDNTAFLAHDFELIAMKAIDQRLRYDVTSYIDEPRALEESNFVLRDALLLPSGFNPASLAFATRLRKRYDNDTQIVNAVLRFFHDEKFSYTLEPPPLGKNPVDEFLFSTQAGFCEHYASAFVVLMRATGIPARVVTGYQGGEINPVDGYMLVRQSDAHAWAEVWLQNRGWVRIDPTAAVAPERIERNAASALPRKTFGPLDGLINLTIGKDSFIAKLRYNWDAVTNSWNQRILNFNPENQKDLVRKLGFDDVDWRTLIVLLFGVGGVVFAIISLPLIVNRQKRDRLNAAFVKLCQLMKQQGYPRYLYEGPRDYRMRLVATDSTLRPDKKIVVDRFLMLYEEVQYGTVSTASKNAAISQLNALLSQCR